MSQRQDAMDWWTSLTSPQKTQICDTNTDIVGNVRRWETLTGKEIHALYEMRPYINPDNHNNDNQGTQRSPFGIGS